MTPEENSVPVNIVKAAGKGRAVWRWLLRLFLAALVLAVLVVGFYTEENWRGRRAWESYQKELARQGLSLDIQTIIPPALPPEKNFACNPWLAKLHEYISHPERWPGGRVPGVFEGRGPDFLNDYFFGRLGGPRAETTQPARGGRGGGGRDFDSGGLQQMLRQSVKTSEFSKAFRLEDFLKKEDWEYEPLAIGSIYEQAIFPYYVEKKPAELGAQWDARIKADLTIKQAVMSDSEYAIYYSEKYPGLLWKRAKYLYEHNVNPVLAMADMLKVIRDNPTHADAGDWLKELRDAVNKAQPDAPPTAGGIAPAAANN